MSAQNPWKPCDLRGVFPVSVSVDLLRRVGAAAGSEIAEGARVVVGGDFRLSTPGLKAALIEGLVSTGLQVLDVGQAPTPVVYFAAARADAAAVFIVTASHNPPEHNGLKWMIGRMPPTPEELTRIRESAELGAWRRAEGACDIWDPVPAYFEWITSRWQGLAERRTRRLVLDAGNGAWSVIAPRVFRALGFDVQCLHCEPDGNFPNRPPDCARTANLVALREAVVARQGSIGIAWDGDGDRVAFVDEDGVHASTDEVSILFARHVLGSAAGPESAAATENVACDIKLSDVVRREVLQLGGVPLLERSGHAFMRSCLLANNAILGLDACGHYFFREAESRDDGLYSALYMLRIMKGGQTLGELRRTVPPIFSTPELRIPAGVLDFGSVVERLRSAFPGAGESNVDGARLLLDEGVVLARQSSTEQVVSFRIEGFSRQSFVALLSHCREALPEAAALFE